jgi:RNA polymerase sigma-70 factor (ECF subfamily)
MTAMETTTFQAIYDTHAGDVYRFARYLTASEDAAADITAETFLRAWVGRASIRTATVKAYLLAIARNLARDRQRHARRCPGGEMPERSVAPDAEGRLELDRALEAVRALAPAYRDPLMLVASGLSYEEAGGVLGLPVGTVKIRVHRARQMLAAATPSPGRSSR